MTKLCGWKDGDCNDCPYCEYDPIRCVFEEEFLPLVKWLFLLIKERSRINPIGWGSSYRYYYGKKDVYEWLIYDLPYEYKQKFWELWRDGGNQAFKQLGFGVFKEKGDWGNWILFWEVKFKDVLLETLQEVA